MYLGVQWRKYFFRTAAPGSAVFPWFKMMFWDVFTDVLLHSQRHFDSFACDSCQFHWSTPHLSKTLEKQNKTKKTNKNHISRLFGRGGPAKTLCVFLFFPRFFWFWSLSAICTLLYICRSVSSCVQACRNLSFNHCSYEHTGSEDQDRVFQFWNVRTCPT